MTSPHTPVTPISPEMRIVTPSQSIAASADRAEALGHATVAQSYRRCADHAVKLGAMWGDVLYREFAREAAQFVGMIDTTQDNMGGNCER